MHATFSRLLSTLFFALALALPAQAADNSKDRDKVTLNFVGADIQSVVKTVGMITGKNFLLDPRVTGQINIVSANPVAKELVYPILLSALRLQGFTAVEGNGVIKILPEADAKLNYSPTVEGTTHLKGDQIITQVFALKYESAAQLLPVLRPLIAPNNVINAYPNNNTLVITDYAENLRRIDKIIQAIDVQPNSEIDVIRLHHASALDIAQLLPRLMPEAAAQANIPGAQPKLAFAIDGRINGLIVRAENQAIIAKVRKLVESLDIETSETGNIHVVYLRNAEATKVAETLRGILGGASGGNVQTQPQPVGQQPVAPGQPGTAGGAVAIVNIPQTSGGGTIQAYAATNSLVIVAPDFVYNGLRGVIDKLDARRAQVFIEALVVEVSTTVAAEFGIQWQNLTGTNSSGVQGIGGTNFNTGGTNNNIVSVAGNISNAGPGLNIGIIKGKITLPGIGEILNLGVLARALEADGNSNILSTPNILTVDNEEAKIIVGQNVPFITGTQTSTTGGLANPFQTIERKDIGLQLKVKPTVSEGGSVKLQLFQEVSSLGTNTTAGFITNKRSIESTVLVDDRQIIVLGGLIQDDVRNNVDKVPVLGNLPLLGNLFKYETRARTKTNLMVFIRPVILRDNLGPQVITNERYDYIRNEQGSSQMDHRWVLPNLPVPQLPAIPPAPAKLVDAPKPQSELSPARQGPVVTPLEVTPSPVAIMPRTETQIIAPPAGPEVVPVKPAAKPAATAKRKRNAATNNYDDASTLAAPAVTPKTKPPGRRDPLKPVQ
ncbi:MAG: type II secretion system secretin GspD [Burkholderiales bacterium]